jgi:hypothetical protein
MTVDERIERLTERHEALTQSIELMHSDWQERWKAVTTALEKDGENIRALARIAEIRKQRIERLESQ